MRCFFGKLKTPKSCSEINWPITSCLPENLQSRRRRGYALSFIDCWPLSIQDLELEYLHFWRLGLDYSVLNFLSFKPLNKETETQKSWKICQNFNSWMMKFTIVQKSHLALSNLAKLVFWSILSFKKPTSHGVWMPNDCNLNKYVSIVRLNHGHFFFNWSLFSWNPELLGLGRQIGQVNSEAFGVFLAKIISTILVQWVLCPCFSLFLLSTRPLYPNLKYLFGIWIWI